MGTPSDKSWMTSYRFSSCYIQGVKNFLNVAKDFTDSNGRVRCPCKNCINIYLKPLQEVKMDLYQYGISENYTNWVHHGETSQPRDSLDGSINSDNELEDSGNDVSEMLDDMCNATFMDTDMEDRLPNQDNNMLEGEVAKFAKLWNDSHCELYPGSQKYSKLSFLLKMINIKALTNSSNKSFFSNLELFKDALPRGETLPSSSYEVKKLMRDLGLGYVTIDACVNDCVLFWKENENLDTCPTCKAPRWKLGFGKRKKVAQKILRHFPLVPRLQRLFMSKDIGENMRWHKEKRVDDDTIRHPADATEWKDFDQKYAWFGKDARNVRLGLASDGFNPFGNMSTSYSMWPVIVTPYNLPPWKCMKENFLMLSLLIPGKESPGNNIDVYLRPLIDELKELWETGVTTYDAYSGKNFQLHAALLWTINDFPAYGMLSGWSTKGKLACPVCNKWTCSLTLKNGVKQCYMGHRRYLHAQHSWRKSRKFDGKPEHGSKPEELSGDEVLRQLDLLPKSLVFGKTPNQKKRARGPEELNWTKRSIFFELPYWKTLKLRHNLDVMHIEKNICENILGTLMNIDGKSKDNIKARMDLEAMGIRKELHLQQKGNKFFMPLACYTLPKPERRKFCEWLQSIRLPDGYASNLSRCVSVQDCKVMGMKSHDYHIFLQRLLPASICGSLRSEVYTALSELSSFFKELCSKTLKRSTVKKLQSDIILIICKLEMIYPPSFFVVMMHLAIHLPREVELGGPVHYRWMYFIERLVDKEILFLVFLNNFPVQIGVENGFSIFSNNARPLGATEYKTLSHSDFEKLQWYVLNNCEDVDEYLKIHIEELQKESVIDVQKRHQAGFASWFKECVGRLRATGLVAATDHIYALGLGPDIRIARYSGIIVNGVRFHTVERDNFRRTQNNGVSVTGEHKSKEIEFYGVLTDIIDLQYVNGNHVFLFKCDWWDVGDKNGIKTDGNLVSVNVSRKWYTGDSFVLSSQVQQVFYVSDMKNGGHWKIVQKSFHRNIFDVPEKEKVCNEDSILNDEPYQQYEADNSHEVDQNGGENLELLHPIDVLPDEVDVGQMFQGQNSNPIYSSDEEDDTTINYDDADTDVLEDSNDSDNEDEDDD
ncbi:uncharacterized protein LOC130015519 [Mercurialis annua]|uniref:uncharacterized protein LOC130015519 n=1 Tax=Mercurialis annua TaxID=3986 RepID=UPI0024AD175A|nr:uncharacterized protein LOC130015519 [Mercurialis annua]